MSHKSFCYSVFLVLAFFVSGCTNQPAESPELVERAEPTITTQLTIPPTSISTQIKSSPVPATSTPEPTTIPVTTEAASTNRLVVCMTEPPLPLNSYTTVSSGQTIMAVLSDGPVEYVRFSYQPTILDESPTIDSGSVTLQEVTVAEGDTFYDMRTGRIEAYSGTEATMKQMRVLFTLRPDVQWSDGTPLTAQDSVYAYDLLRAAGENSNLSTETRQLVTQTASYRSLDENTVEWTGVPGLITPDYLKFFFPPLPQHRNMTLETEFPEVGWGAFRFMEWVPGSHLLAARNPHYFRANEGLPFIEEIEFRFLEPPYDDLVTRIGANNCDIIGQSLVYALPIEEWQEKIGETDWQLVTAPSTTGMQLVFNFRSDALTSEPNIREAIAACIDRSALAELTSGTVANSYLHPFDPALMDLDLPAYNPQEAIALLSQMERQPELTLKLAVRDSVSRTVVDQLVANLAECGFVVEPDYLPVEEFFASWPDGSVFGGQYDLVLFPLNAADRNGCKWFVSASIPSAENPEELNISGWMNEVFDQACEQAYASLSIDDRVTFEGQAQSVFGEMLPSLPLWWSPKYSILHCRVAGYQLDPLATELSNIEEISLAQSCES